MALYLNGNKIINSLVIDGTISGKVALIDSPQTSTAWASPIMIDDVGDYDVFVYSGTYNNVAYSYAVIVTAIPTSSYKQYGDTYLKMHNDGSLEIASETGKTNIVNSAFGYK